MAKVKITANFRDSEADYSHVDLNKQIFTTVRANIAEQWVHNGWAVIVEPKGEEPEGEDDPPKIKQAGIETAALRGAPETTEGIGMKRQGSKRKPLNTGTAQKAANKSLKQSTENKTTKKAVKK